MLTKYYLVFPIKEACQLQVFSQKQAIEDRKQEYGLKSQPWVNTNRVWRNWALVFTKNLHCSQPIKIKYFCCVCYQWAYNQSFRVKYQNSHQLGNKATQAIEYDHVPSRCLSLMADKSERYSVSRDVLNNKDNDKASSVDKITAL